MKKLFLILIAATLILVAMLLLWVQNQGPEFQTEVADKTRNSTETTTPDPLAQCLGEQAFKRQSYKLAFQEFSKRAGSDASAEYHLGLMYEKGLAAIPDPHKAMKWFLRAAEQNHIEAFYTLGLMSLEGRAIPKNYSEAFKWFQRAALLNHAESQYHIGTMYRDGRGTETDQFKAYGWLALAFENGFQPAEGLMKNFDIGSTEAEKITENFRQQVNETVRNTDRPRGPACAQ